MRFALAITSLVLSGLLLILGIGQRTFLAGPKEIAISAELPEGITFATIPGDALLAKSGTPFIEVRGDDPFAATGAPRDVAGWIAPIDHLELSDSPSASAWEHTEVSAVFPEDTPAEELKTLQAEAADFDPRGSDLWLRQALPAETESGDPAKIVRIPITSTAPESILVSVASDSQTAAGVSLVWVQDTRTPWAGPLLVAGGLLALIGAVLYLLAVDYDRRGLGPRRGQKGPLWGIRNALSARKRKRGNAGTSGAVERVALSMNRPRARSVIPIFGIVCALGLSGCSAQYWPDLDAQPVTEPEAPTDASNTSAAPTPVTPEQIDRIIDDVAAVAGAADDALDAGLLTERFTGDALAQRTANYTVRQSVPDYKVVPPRITADALEYELVQSTEGWPRTIFVTVESDPGTTGADEEPDTEAASPSLALIMTQENPHENFMVSRVVSLRGGITMPEAAPTEEGTALLADDLQTLKLAPGEVGAAYAAVLAGGTGVDQASLFNLEGDTLIERSGKAWATQSQATADAAGQGVQYSVTATQSTEPIVSLSTGVGGALVATTVIEERIEEPGSGRWKPTPPASVTALSGLSGQQDRLVSVVSHQLLFYVPGKDSNESIQLLGFSSDLTGARN